MNLPKTEGFIDVGPGRIWYEECGSGPALLLLHGGPGADSGYLEPLMQFAEKGYRVVRYDQLGCGKADRPDDKSLWNVKRYCDEVETVRQSLRLGEMHFLGQSWGSFLALEYALTYDEHLRSLVLYGGAASTRQCVAGMNSLRDQLPKDSVARMRHLETTGRTDDPEYIALLQVLLDRHLCRVQPWPDEVATGMAQLATPVYGTMWGPNEFTCTGTLQEWNRIDRLGEILTPTLILCGRYDEVIPACSETMHSGIPDSRLHIFEQSSHLSHFEEPDAFEAVLTSFLPENAVHS